MTDPDVHPSPGDTRLPPVSLTPAELLVTAGKSRGISVLIRSPLYVGRDSSCGLQLFDDASSRRHFRILAEEGAFFVEDLESRNGTFVNGAKVSRHQLSHSDVIVCGETQLRFICPEGHNPHRTTVELVPSGVRSTRKTVDRLVDTRVVEAGLREQAAQRQLTDPFTERLILTLRLGQDFARRSDWQELFQVLEGALERILPFNRLVLCRYSAGARTLSPIVQRRAKGDPSGTRIALRQDLIDRAVTELSCIGSPDDGGRWTIVGPLAAHANPLGVIYMESPPTESIQEDLVLLSALCRQAGLVLEQCELLSTVRYQKLQMEELHREAAEVARELRAEKLKLGAVLDGFQDAIALVNPRGQLLLANPTAQVTLARMCARTPDGRLESVAGVPLTDLLGQLTDQRSVHTRELASPDGRTLELSAFQVPIEPSDADPRQIGTIGLTLVFRDVTERKRAEESLRQSQSRLAQAQKMEAVGRLAGGVAHEFNNMLTVISGYCEILAQQTPHRDARRMAIEEIRHAAARAASTTRQLLSFGRRQILRPRVLDLNQIINVSRELILRFCGEAITVELDLEPDLDRIKADAAELDQALISLVLNARDAMPQGGRLRIGTRNVDLPAETADAIGVPVGRYVVIEVGDTGIGMDAETLAHLFEPFFTTKEMGKGTGLGLAAVHGIARQCGGGIGVESHAGKGSTFRIYLPSLTPEITDARAVAEIKELPGGTETILVIEDERPLRQLVVEVLRSCGYTVIEADQAVTALQELANFTSAIHLVLTDVILPGMNGYALACRIRSERPEARVLYMSGYSDSALPPEILASGHAFLPKPFHPLALARKVRDVLDAAPPATTPEAFQTT